MNVLLLGGTGVIGSEVLSLCLKKGYNVTVFSRGNKDVGFSEVEVITGNYKKMPYDSKLFSNKNFDIVVDFLSRTPKELARLFNILKNQTKQYIFISTSCVYRRSNNQDLIITEESEKPNYNWSYSTEKYECEEFLKVEAKKCGNLYTVVRPYITYGNTRIPFGLAPSPNLHWTIIGRIMSGKPFFIWDKGDTLCTFTHSLDFAKGIVGLFDNAKAFNECFHITSNEVHSWNKMLEILCESIGHKIDIVKIPATTIAKSIPEYRGLLLEDRRYNAVFDNSKIMDAVPGLSFDCSLVDGIKNSIKYYESMSNKSIDYIYDANIDQLISKNSNYKLGYIDYLNENNKKNYIKYHLARLLSPQKQHLLKIFLKEFIKR